ncbi:MAG: DUF3619 family protein [Proteobacteria bacterium]|nr:DUF3619 family protein [Pseudomonadota bacterium]
MTKTSNAAADAQQERFGRAMAARLSAGSHDLPHDIAERLRAGRMQALARRKVVQVRTAPAGGVVGVSGGAALLGSGDGGWWTRVASVLPLVALVAGLVTISVWQDEDRTAEVADVDAALLTDELPPAAYTDPGFAQFLKREASTR